MKLCVWIICCTLTTHIAWTTICSTSSLKLRCFRGGKWANWRQVGGDENRCEILNKFTKKSISQRLSLGFFESYLWVQGGQRWWWMLHFCDCYKIKAFNCISAEVQHQTSLIAIVSPFLPLGIYLGLQVKPMFSPSFGQALALWCLHRLEFVLVDLVFNKKGRLDATSHQVFILYNIIILAFFQVIFW